MVQSQKGILTPPKGMRLVCGTEDATLPNG